MFGASSELASVMEFGFYRSWLWCLSTDDSASDDDTRHDQRSCHSLLASHVTSLSSDIRNLYTLCIFAELFFGRD